MMKWFLALVVSGVCSVVLFAGCGGGEAGTTCESDDECADGLTCRESLASTVVGGDCDIVQRICTTDCSDDSDCEEWDLACTASSSCGGPSDICT